MIQVLTDALAVATPVAIGSSVLLGLLIGAFYGWYALGPEHPPVWPFALWTVGIAFVVVLGVLATMERTTGSPGASFGRAVLWTFTCGAIPLGRLLRGLTEAHVLKRKRNKLKRHQWD